jgi:hypothetical protein
MLAVALSSMLLTALIEATPVIDAVPVTMFWETTVPTALTEATPLIEADAPSIVCETADIVAVPVSASAFA